MVGCGLWGSLAERQMSPWLPNRYYVFLPVWPLPCFAAHLQVHSRTCQELPGGGEPHAFSEGARLVEPRAPKTALERTLRNDFGIPSDVPLFIAREARCSEHERIFKHDIVMTSEPELTLGEVQMLFSVGDVTLSVLQKWAIAADETRAWKCTISGDFVLVRVEHITCALIWGGRSSQRKTVLKPLRS